MEHSQKNTDCYFFYYSTCLKGDGCAFRHEPSALGCETMCSYWLQGNCLNEHCNFRHMELKKNRKSIACYWETQPGGCRKPHCCFMHKNSRPATTEPNNPVRNSDPIAKPVNQQEWSNRQDDGKYDSDPRTTLDGSSTESDQGRGGSEAGSFIGSPAVDPLVVNFEEESDNESVPSPTKPQLRMLHVKTLEEIKLERIQAESAAYYNYASEDIAGSAHLAVDRSILTEAVSSTSGGGLGSTTLERNLRARLANRLQTQGTTARANLDFQVLSLDEIRKRRRRMPPTTPDESPSREKIPRLRDDSISSFRESLELGEADNIRGPIAAVTAAAPPVRLRRSNRTIADSSSPRKKIARYSGGEQVPTEMTSSDSSQDAAAVPDRLTLVATRPSLSARDDRNDRDIITGSKIQGVEENSRGDIREQETRLQESNGLSSTPGETLHNGTQALRATASRSLSIPSMSDDDYLMMDATSVDHSAAADDILQDIDELLND